MSEPRDDAREPRLAELLRQVRREQFPPGFADRVMRSVAEGEVNRALAPALSAQFLRLAPVALALIAGLLVYNVWIAGTGRPSLDQAFGLAPVTIEEAYSLETMLRAGGPAAGDDAQ